MPAVLRVIADWNPVSAVTAAARHLWGNPNPSATIPAWPMQHPVAASLLWSVALLVIFAPLATLLYRRRTTGRARAPWSAVTAPAVRHATRYWCGDRRAAKP